VDLSSCLETAVPFKVVTYNKIINFTVENSFMQTTYYQSHLSIYSISEFVILNKYTGCRIGLRDIQLASKKTGTVRKSSIRFY
jgi:hypothetical protein